MTKFYTAHKAKEPIRSDHGTPMWRHKSNSDVVAAAIAEKHRRWAHLQDDRSTAGSPGRVLL